VHPSGNTRQHGDVRLGEASRAGDKR
jgi:hypothetical protein